MTTSVLGTLSFDDTPDVNGALVLTTATGVASGAIQGAANQIAVSGTTVPVIALAQNPVIPGVSSLTLPSGTTAQRPASPVAGMTRYNTTLVEPETFSNGAWLPGSRVVQVASGNIPIKTGNITPRLTTVTTTPTSTETSATDIWTTSFTPLVVGSQVVVQFTITAYVGTAARTIYLATFANGACIGMTAAWAAVASTATVGASSNISFQAVFTTTSTAAITFLGRLGLIMTGTAASTAFGVNQLQSGNFGNAMISEYRILEMIP